MIKKAAVLTVFMICVGMVLVPAYAWEKDNIKIVPSFNFEERWDSNIFYDPSDEKSDFITILTPGILGEYKFGTADKHSAFIDYKVDLGIFGEYNDQNYGNHDVKAGVALDFKDYTLDVDNRFQFTSSRAGTEFEHRVLRKIDTAKAVLGWHYNKMDFDTGYKFYIVDYLSDTLDQLKRYENSLWITGYMEVMPKTKALLEFTYTNIQYPDASGRDGNAYRGMVGLKGDLTAKLTGIIKAGYKYKGYEDNSATDAFSNPVAEIALLYEIIEDRLDMTFSYNREPFESVYGNNNYYVGDHFLSTINYRFGNGFVAKGEAMFFHNAYPNSGITESSKRRDNEWALGIGLDYMIKEWATAGVGYRYHQRDSNINTRDYDQHVIYGNLKLTY